MSQITIIENCLYDNKKVFCWLHEISQNKMNEMYAVLYANIMYIQCILNEMKQQQQQ
jgi:hypothetical protein